MTEREWIGIAADVGDAYGKAPSERWIALWYGVLDGFEAAIVRESVAIHAAGPQGAFMPNGGQLAAIARELVNPSADFDQVWDEVVSQLRLTGSWGRPELADPVLALVRVLGGWKALCQVPSDQIPTVRAQARRIWEDMRRRAELEPARARIGRRATAGELVSVKTAITDGPPMNGGG